MLVDAYDEKTARAWLFGRHLERYGPAGADDFGSEPVTQEWCIENVLAPARLELTGELIDLTDLPTRRRIEERHAELLRRGPVVAQTSPWRCQDVPGLPRPRSAPTCRTCRLFASIVALRRFCRRGLSRRRSRVRVPSLPLLFACISAVLARSLCATFGPYGPNAQPMDTEAAPVARPAPS